MMETVYCGVDFHARMQTIAYCDSANGEIQLAQLDHRKDDVRGVLLSVHQPGDRRDGIGRMAD